MPLGDVRDVRAFVATVLDALGLGLGADEFEQLVDAGVLECCELRADYDPAIGTFEGYLSRYLGRRLISAWHRSHENHSRPRVDGKRPWLISPEPVSLEDVLGRPGFDQRRLSAAVHHRRRATAVSRCG